MKTRELLKYKISCNELDKIIPSSQKEMKKYLKKYNLKLYINYQAELVDLLKKYLIIRDTLFNKFEIAWPTSYFINSFFGLKIVNSRTLISSFLINYVLNLYYGFYKDEN